MVTTGTIHVIARWRGTDYPFEKPITVTPRDWSTATPAPQEVANGFSPKLTASDPPTAGSDIGRFEATVSGPFNAVEVADGPNKGYTFVTSQSASAQYLWTGSPAILDVTSPNHPAFAAANCGDYHPVTKPYGFASASQIRDDVIRHESGAVESHYAFFSSALSQPNLNFGLLMESRLRRTAPNELKADVERDLREALDNILNSAAVEPCGGNPQGTVKDGTCQSLGFANWFPYQACPRP